VRVVLSEVAIARLEAFEDQRGRIIPEFPEGRYREVFEGSFRIVHTLGSDRVEIATVFDASRGLRADELQ
jgi:plasmid stabilization system protein ParE